MVEPASLRAILDRAAHVFSLASELGQDFQALHNIPGRGIGSRTNHRDRHRLKFEPFRIALAELMPVTEHPPKELSHLVDVLFDAAEVAEKVEITLRQNTIGMGYYLEYFSELISVGRLGQQAVNDVREMLRAVDPFSHLGQWKPTEVHIDSTPSLPCPPNDQILLAMRDIPPLMAKVNPTQSNTIELIAETLARLLENQNHSRPAAYWAIHQAIQTGYLRAGYILFELPGALVHGDDRSAWRGGGQATTHISSGKPASFDRFKVIATELLWDWWRSFTAMEDSIHTTVMHLQDKTTHPSDPKDETYRSGKQKKKSTQKGEAKAKLLAGLLKYHNYSDGSCLVLEPVGNNELAKIAKVSTASASRFFEVTFGGYKQYAKRCQDIQLLVTHLRILSGDLRPRELNTILMNESKDDEED